MFHITRTDRLAWAALVLAALIFPGCADPYEHEKLRGDSAEVGRIQRMLRELRQAGTGAVDSVMAEQAVEGLGDRDRTFLRDTLAELVAADTVELEKADRFGEQICRATFSLKSDGVPARISILLVDDGDGDLRWFKRN